ncbi:MAG: hypothetical protein JXR40_08800 [Pontiellaceae bacterium]|nr:hypothetical protein [Pontiellaceae bacterium]
MKLALLLPLVIVILSGCKTSDTQRSAIPEGRRAISIALSANAFNNVQPNDRIDLFADSQLVCSNVVVLAVNNNTPQGSVTLQLTEKLVATKQQAGALHI